MKHKSFLVLASVISALLLTGCPEVLEIINKDTTTTTTTTLESDTTTTLESSTTTSPTTTTASELESRTLYNEGAASGYDGKLAVVSDGRQYIVQNNIIMSPSTQVIEYSTATGDFEIKQFSGSSIPGLVSFPSIFIGNNHKHTTTDSNLPKQYSSILSIPIRWTWSDSEAISPDFIALFEIWFTSSNVDSVDIQDKLIQIWLHKGGRNPTNGTPLGTVQLSNVSWNVWTDAKSVTYVATSDQRIINFDLKDFIRDAIEVRLTISNTDYLHDVFAGFRIWSNGTGLSSSGFSAVVR